MDTQIELSGDHLVAWCHRYETPSLRFTGELLTRLDSLLGPEEYFNRSKIAELFEILEWHLGPVSESCS